MGEAKSHLGQLNRSTEHEAGKNLAGKKGPTKLEMRMVFEENPSDYKILKSHGMTDQEIYDNLKHR